MAKFKNRTDQGVTVSFNYGSKNVRLPAGGSYSTDDESEVKSLRRLSLHEVGSSSSSESKSEKEEKK